MVSKKSAETQSKQMVQEVEKSLLTNARAYVVTRLSEEKDKSTAILKSVQESFEDVNNCFMDLDAIGGGINPKREDLFAKALAKRKKTQTSPDEIASRLQKSSRGIFVSDLKKII
jgi:RecG-like helicase